jgi:type II secretory pathway pseudopilin PulG
MGFTMGRRSRRKREVELFNFSFLDILACVIGLLIFILSIVVVSAGGARNRQTDGRLANAEHQLEQSLDSAKRESDRRQRAEQILSEQSNDFADPKAAAAAVRGEIGLFENETARLDADIAISLAKTDSLQKALQSMGQSPVVNVEASVIQELLRRLDEETADIRNQAADARHKAQASVRQVQFYIPHLREVNRYTLWVEISKDHVWCLNSDDYLQEPINAESTRFTRVAGAKGTSVTAMVSGTVLAPPTLSSVDSQDTVLEVAVQPDGYEAFRALRQWAWKKGFSVNWVPQDENPIILTRTNHALEQ